LLREELIGPSTLGAHINEDTEIAFATWKDAQGPWRRKDSDEEILSNDPPSVRYGVGVLYPLSVDLLDEFNSKPDDNYNNELKVDDERPLITEDAVKDIDEIAKRLDSAGENENDDFDLSSTNTRRPSSMAISFLAEIPDGASVVVEFTGGRYFGKEVRIAGKKRKWWLRHPISLTATCMADNLCRLPAVKCAPDSSTSTGLEGLPLNVEVYSRPFDGFARLRLLTVCVVNRSENTNVDEFSIFQSSFNVKVLSAEGRNSHILPYPKVENAALDDEEQQLEMLYRNYETYAVGHGCAADWDEPEDNRVSVVHAQPMPFFEAPSVTPDRVLADGTPLDVSMKALAELEHGQFGYSQLDALITRYEEWINDSESRIELLPLRYHAAAHRNLSHCKHCAGRMREGVEYIKANPRARRAFRLANLAILMQQLQSKKPLRQVSLSKSVQIGFSVPYSEPDIFSAPPGQGKWRAFQIAFLLMNLRSVADPNDPSRDIVELIWFPTGGGKTEAYLGLTAYATFLRRLVNPEDVGVNVLMRYTLRLLTAQQFQRAASLICVMEAIRQKNPDLGHENFSIGIWLGSSTTPNKRADAVAALRKMIKDPDEENSFLLSRCPWCGAEMGPCKVKGGNSKKGLVIGYELVRNTVAFKCPDKLCRFHGHLPVYVIDEDIYEVRPSLVIGTVDKFAMLAWRPEARAIFGLAPGGERVASPPGLIIQDELHLISGPLGSIVGLYEMLIENLCTDFRPDTPVIPKLVCSTATIRRFAEQVRALYARDKAALFPPSGLDISDSFFARYALSPDGSTLPGRVYIGIHAPGHGSMQTTQVRAFSSLLQATVAMSPEDRDPWWSLLVFFNSLRELGTTLSLFQSDIPSYLRVIQQREARDYAQMRRLGRILELTGRIRSDRIADAIADLEVSCTTDGLRPVDVCLASNVIEVGIDIDRLSLMAVFGQPKTTSQYIQVTGRVGRKWHERPGLIITLYSPSKPRDRSHFEKFRSYHERLYAQVEPTSVTPFSPPAVDRVLHAVLAAYARQLGDEKLAQRPNPYPEKLVRQFYKLVEERVNVVDPAERDNTLKVLDKRLREWQDWESITWQGSWQQEDVPMLREPGSYVTMRDARLSWPTPMSMRNVDAECQAEITLLYLLERGMIHA